MIKNTSIYIVLWFLFQLFAEVNSQLALIKPKKRYRHTTTLVGKRLYVLGGIGDDPNTGKQFFYLDVSIPFNAKELLWQDSTSTNIVPSHDDAASVTGGANNNTLILYSGSLDATKPLIYTLDAQNNLWSNPKLNVINIERKVQLTGVADYNGKMYLFGGMLSNVDNVMLNDMLIFDTVNLNWGKGSVVNAPTQRRNYGATLLPNGKIIYIGGINGDHLPLNEVYLYDTINDAWSNQVSLLK
ncbi:hypothetical protein C1645_213461 [Glomus cerebriforme]|uniref:Galactose oxidase n=1 Tax=Glomus cerebriforme TaxID=658196 RepID=A0A397T1V3_9GLOM|nr:hypothetical protein C1645_213461 [Glomus cerebriforme]